MSDEEFDAMSEVTEDFEEYDEDGLLDDEEYHENTLLPGADDEFVQLAHTYEEGKTSECLRRTDIIKRQDQELKRVEGVTGLPIPYVRIILQSYRWDTMKALNDWSESPEKVATAVGIPVDAFSSSSSSTGSNANTTCSICYDDFDAKELTALGCGHQYCGDCWKGYLVLEVKEKKKTIGCPGTDAKSKKCRMVVDELTVFRLLNDREAEKRFQDALINSFVEDNPLIKWCPGKGCSNAILLKEINQEHNEVASCDCGVSFCFRCNNEEHRPATCNMAQEWRKKNSGGDEDLDKQLIATIARPCPRCKASVQKNGGCNHMSCISCKFHFCWQCMKKFGNGNDGGSDGYTTHKCNGFYQEDGEVMMQKEELKRFNWYSDRYNNHHKSKIQEVALMKKADDVIADLMDTFSLSLMTASFYTNALQQIIQNRQVLKYSYVFGYYRPIQCPYVNKNIFENLQRDLERHTEMLSNMVEEKTIKMLHSDYLSIINQTKIAQKLLESLFSAASDWQNPIENNRRAATKTRAPVKEAETNGKKKKKKDPARRTTYDQDEDFEMEPPTEYDATAEDDYEIRARQEDNRRRNEEARKVQERKLAKMKEEEEMERVIEESRKTYKASTKANTEKNAPQNFGGDVMDDDWELQLAIQASLGNV